MRGVDPGERKSSKELEERHGGGRTKEVGGLPARAMWEGEWRRRS